MSPTEYPTLADSHDATNTADAGTEDGQLQEVLAERDELAGSVSLMADQLRLSRRELADFKDRVVQVATGYAEHHAWCEVVDQALAELGLRRPPLRYQAEAVLRIQFSATRANTRHLPDPGWVRDSILGMDEIREAIRLHFALDSDHEDWTIEDVDLELHDVEEYPS